MPILRQQPTIVIHEDQIVKLRFAARSHEAASPRPPTLSPAVYISGTPRGLWIDATEPLCHTNSINPKVIRDSVNGYPGRVIYTSFLKNLESLTIKARAIAAAVGNLLGYLVLTLGQLLNTLRAGVASLIRVVAILMEETYRYLVLPFTSVSLLYFSVVALRQYQTGQTMVLDRPFIVCLLYTTYTFLMTGLLLLESWLWASGILA